VVDVKLDTDTDLRIERTQQQHEQQQQKQQQRTDGTHQHQHKLKQQNVTSTKSDESNNGSGDTQTKKVSSGYVITSHSAEIIDADIYISDGSESDEDLMADLQQLEVSATNGENEEGTGNIDDDGQQNQHINSAGRSIEMILSGSRMGLMRRGIHRPSSMLLVQPNRQWARQSSKDKSTDGENKDGSNVEPPNDDAEDPAAAEERWKREKEEELAKLDPAERAARLLVEKQRKLEEAKILARKLESEQNAGRDPCLFSKRTSFDIRFDQIDDKPWARGGDMTDFFNYGFSEEDWLEYAEQQLMIRQELIDANRQNRASDPSIVPVIPKKPKKQNPRVAVVISNTNTSNEDSNDTTEADGGGTDDDTDGDDNAPIVGPLFKKEEIVKNEAVATENAATTDDSTTATQTGSTEKVVEDIEVVGGAWGAAPGSVLAKLIEEQEKQQHNQNQNHMRIDQKESFDIPVENLSPKKGRGDRYHSNKYEVISTVPHSSGNDSGNNNNQDRHFHSYQQQQQGWNNSNPQGDRNHYQNQAGNPDRNDLGNQGLYNNNNRNPGGDQVSDWNDRSHERAPVHHHRQHHSHHQRWGEGGRGGRGGGRDHGGRGRGGNFGDRGDFQYRKRPRGDFEDRHRR